jgi:LemA protein
VLVVFPAASYLVGLLGSGNIGAHFGCCGRIPWWLDVLLKQRHDEVPRLGDVCKGYMQYERDTLQSLIAARSLYATAATIDQKVQASGSLSASVGKLFAIAENYPALQANASFLELQKRLPSSRAKSQTVASSTTMQSMYSIRAFNRCRIRSSPVCSGLGPD